MTHFRFRLRQPNSVLPLHLAYSHINKFPGQNVGSERAISSIKEENQQLRQQLQQERDRAYRQLEERERQLGQVNQQLSKKMIKY